MLPSSSLATNDVCWDHGLKFFLPGVSQDNPVHPSGQVQVLGAEQLPPLRQGSEHTETRDKGKAIAMKQTLLHEMQFFTFLPGVCFIS
jgi:hypothetical protein